jgi:hypothetical protein
MLTLDGGDSDDALITGALMASDLGRELNDNRGS